MFPSLRRSSSNQLVYAIKVVKCPIYSFANLSQLTIEYHFYKSLFALMWLVPELMIQYRGYFIDRFLPPKQNTHTTKKTIPFITFVCICSFEQQQSTCIRKIRFIFVFMYSIHALKTYLNSNKWCWRHQLFFEDKDIICKCIQAICLCVLAVSTLDILLEVVGSNPGRIFI